MLDLMGRIIDARHAAPGKGLPIGTLTSQHFANFHLNGLDRLLLERCRVRGMARYMDDLVWWGDDKAAVRHVLAEARACAPGELGLTVKDTARVGHSRDGLILCGYRILPGRLLLSRRRKRPPEFTTGRSPDLNRPSSTAPHPVRQNAKTAGALAAWVEPWRRLAGRSLLFPGTAP